MVNQLMIRRGKMIVSIGREVLGVEFWIAKKPAFFEIEVFGVFFFLFNFW